MIEQLAQSLAPDYRLMPLYTPDSPVFLAIAMPMAEGVSGLKPRLPAGRGLTMQQAMLSAGAEAVELRASLARSHLTALASRPRQNGYRVVPVHDLLSGMSGNLPAQQVLLDCAPTLSEPVLADASSTGCAAAPTVDAAITTALWECLERDAVALWWHGGLPAGPLSVSVIDDLQPRLSWWLDQRPRRTRLLDLTTDTALSVVAAISCNADDTMFAVGYAARPHRAEAALAALAEMVQSEAGLAQARLAQDAEAAEWDAFCSAFPPSQFNAGPEKPRAPSLARDALVRHLADLGHRVLFAELTLADDPLPSVRVLVPGLNAMRGAIATDRLRRLCPAASGPCFPEPF